MQPSKSSVLELFEDRLQYLIPLFQRGYVWTLSEQVLPLWDDLMDRAAAIKLFKVRAAMVGEGNALRPYRKHFLGTAVIGARRGGGGGSVANKEVIDGQQRITTLQILLLAFRDVVKELDDEALTDDLKRLTRNAGSYSDPSNQCKVWPTNAGREDMKSLVALGSLKAVCERYPSREGRKTKLTRPLMVQAYLFFHGAISCHLRGVSTADPIKPANDMDELLYEALGKDEVTVADELIASIQRDNEVKPPHVDLPMNAAAAYELLEVLRDGFQIMVLELDEEDDPQIIFETLNARGAPLKPCDLVRNFLFLQAARKGEPVDDLYDTHWKAFDEDPDDVRSGEKFWKREERQGRLKSVRLDLLLYHYTGLRKREEVKVAHVFDEFKHWWDVQDRDTAAEMKRLGNLASHFRVFLSPHQRSRFGLFCRRMQLLEMSTLTPLVFYFLEHHQPDSPAMQQVLVDLESYVVRRFVCGETTKGYNRIFTTRLLADIAKEGSSDPDLLRTKLMALQGDSQEWPSDADFERNWVHRGLYKGKNTAKVRAILEALERDMRSSKQEFADVPEDLTVEHVMPQRWQENWPVENATPAAVAAREELIHSIGNLTLVTGAFNSALSNAEFRKKRPEIVTTSLLRLNAYFHRFDDAAAWTENDVVERAQFLFPFAKNLWPRPSFHHA